MSKARKDAARLIADALFAAENASDQSYGSVAALASILPTMRQQAGVSAVVAHGVFHHVARALELQAEARAALVEAHHHCKAHRGRVPHSRRGAGLRRWRGQAPACAGGTECGSPQRRLIVRLTSPPAGGEVKP